MSEQGYGTATREAMTAPVDYTITIGTDGQPSPGTLTCNPGDTITWVNSDAYDIDAFTLPTCVSPQTDPAPIAPNGGTTRKYTVNNGSKGSFGYSYDVDDDDADTQSGTIDVS
jgi:plastocyanin